MNIYEKVFDSPNWFLKVSNPATTGERSVSYTQFVDEAAIDTYLTSVVASLTTQQTNLTTQASDLGVEIAAIELLIA